MLWQEIGSRASSSCPAVLDSQVLSFEHISTGNRFLRFETLRMLFKAGQPGLVNNFASLMCLIRGRSENPELEVLSRLIAAFLFYLKTNALLGIHLLRFIVIRIAEFL